MEIETLNALNENMHGSLLLAIEVITLIYVLFAIAGFAIYLAGIAWLCFEETRQPARRQMKPAMPEPDEDDLLAVLAAPDEDPGGNLTGGVSRHEPALQRVSISIRR